VLTPLPDSPTRRVLAALCDTVALRSS
jgi:hypothetical protein